MKRVLIVLLSAAIFTSMFSCGKKNKASENNSQKPKAEVSDIKDSADADQSKMLVQETKQTDEAISEPVELTSDNITQYLNLDIFTGVIHNGLFNIYTVTPTADNLNFENVSIDFYTDVDCTLNYLLHSQKVKSDGPYIYTVTLNPDGTNVIDCMLQKWCDIDSEPDSIIFGDSLCQIASITGTVTEMKLSDATKKEREENAKKATVITKDFTVEHLSANEIFELYDGNDASFEKNYTDAQVRFTGTVKSVKSKSAIQKEPGEFFDTDHPVHPVIYFEEGWCLALSKHNPNYDITEYAPGDVLSVTTGLVSPDPDDDLARSVRGDQRYVWLTGNDHCWGYTYDKYAREAVNGIPTRIEKIK